MLDPALFRENNLKVEYKFKLEYNIFLRFFVLLSSWLVSSSSIGCCVNVFLFPTSSNEESMRVVFMEESFWGIGDSISVLFGGGVDPSRGVYLHTKG